MQAMAASVAVGHPLWVKMVHPRRERLFSPLTFAVGTALDNYPLAWVAISGAITTGVKSVVFWRVRRQPTKS
jgi:hypothetical protein